MVKLVSDRASMGCTLASVRLHRFPPWKKSHCPGCWISRGPEASSRVQLADRKWLGQARQCPLYPQKRPSELGRENVRFVPKADSCTATNYAQWQLKRAFSRT